MSDGDEPRGDAKTFLRRSLLGTLLTSLGVCIGIVLGSLMDGPRVLLRRLQEPTLAVELQELEDPEPDELVEFRSLQGPEGSASARSAEPAPEPKKPARVARKEPHRPGPSTAEQAAPVLPTAVPSEPEPEPEPASKPAQPAPKPTPAGTRSRAAVASPGPGTGAVTAPPDREALLRQMAERVRARDGEKAAEDETPRTDPAPPGPVVQVAAYADRAAAEALAVRLRRDGHEAFVSRSSDESGARYRVRVRPSEARKAEEVAKQLTSAGFSVWIARE